VFGGRALADAQASALADRADALIGNMHELSQMVVAPWSTVCGRVGGKGAAARAPRAGAHGNARAAHVACTPTGARSVAVTCTVSGTAAETRIVLRRGQRTVAAGHAPRAGRIALHARQALRHGRYSLVVAVLDGGRPHTVMQRNVRL
jgi:hypothetical protein